MSLIYSSKRGLILGINRNADVPLDVNGLYFSPIRREDVTETKLRLTAEEDYQYRGSEVVVYDRLDLDKLPDLLPADPLLPHADTLYELLPSLTRFLGITLDEDDVEDATIIDNEGGYLVPIVAKASSYGWVGSCDLQFYDLPPLSIPITETDIRW